MQYTEVVLGMVAGLVLFLYGVSRLATGMRAVAGERMQRMLARATTNRFAGVATGTIATTVLDSSSVTIIMVIALVDAGLLTFQASLGVILGANIGTTISSQLIALDVQKYSPIVLGIGGLIMFAGRSESWRHAGMAVFGIGLVFFGLSQMGAAVQPLKDSARFTAWMTQLENPAYGVLAGAIITVVLQSSSATVGIAITLASQDLLKLPAGVAIMLGAEIGTCADTLLATLGRSRDALRAGIFHLLFNVLTVIVGVSLLNPLVNFVVSLGGGTAQQIASAHVTFNVVGAAALVLFLAPIGALLERIVPSQGAVG
ncbi:MAG: Na/Pi cotransporter family protein [Gemmatimonadaceae bacterium]|nr:Na/Pi cotransporter family protein [Gemmatimonadaceae bacterium]